MSDLPIAVHFGAGNIGRGFLGQLYFESGFRTIFIDVDQPLVDALSEMGTYELEIAGDTLERRTIGNLGGVHAADETAVVAALSHARIASVAVGAAILPAIAPTLRKAIATRATEAPLNILVCENLLGAAAVLRNAIMAGASDGLADRFATVDTTIGRMVATIEVEGPVPLIRAEAWCELPVDHGAVSGSLPSIEHMKPVGNFRAEVEKKLYIHNAAHAATAYLGALHGWTYVWEAIEDPAVRGDVDAAMRDVTLALSRRHGLPHSDLESMWSGLRARFANRLLGDTIARVGRDAVRKLGDGERLAGALTCCVSEGIDSPSLIRVIAAALRYAIHVEGTISDPAEAIRAGFSEVDLQPGILAEYGALVDSR